MVRVWLCTSQRARSTTPIEAELCLGACCKMMPCSRLSQTFSAKLVMDASPSGLRVTLVKLHLSMKLATNSVAKGVATLDGRLIAATDYYERGGELLVRVGDARVGLDEAIVGEEHMLVEWCYRIG